MTEPILAPAFCQIAWVVKDRVAAEKFFVETMGIPKFMHMDNLSAKDTEGTYRGRPGN
jgi:methylmalonyl-CoA/ethylmalonyl-CoA epimerase